jgi:streptomycin 6-kinase
MILPSAFIKNIFTSFGDPGRRYLDELPELILKASRRWDLALGDPFPLSYNYVCSATRVDGTPAVLKIGIPNRELNSEINALKVYRGEGAVRLFESAPDLGMILMERLQPGNILSTLADDDHATEIAAGVMKVIQRPPPEDNGFIKLQGWFDELSNLRPRFAGGTGPFREKTVEIVEQLVRELFEENHPNVLLHGDFHHFNILSSDRGWLVIDPKGVIGPAEYEAGPYLLNPWGEMPNEKEAIQRTRRRISILAEHLGFDQQTLINWGICYSLLSALWDTGEDGSGGEYSRAWTDILLRIKI